MVWGVGLKGGVFAGSKIVISTSRKTLLYEEHLEAGVALEDAVRLRRASSVSNSIVLPGMGGAERSFHRFLLL